MGVIVQIVIGVVRLSYLHCISPAGLLFRQNEEEREGDFADPLHSSLWYGRVSWVVTAGCYVCAVVATWYTAYRLMNNIGLNC